jgi:hypothetical protein
VETSAVVETDRNVRSTVLTGGLISELSFNTPKRQGDGPFTMTFNWQPESVTSLGGGVKRHEGAARLPAGFAASLSFVPSAPVLDIRLPSIRPRITETKPSEGAPPVRSYGAIDIDCLSLQVGADSNPSLDQYIKKILADGHLDAGEYRDTAITALDGSGQISAQLVYSAAPVAAILHPNRALVGPFASNSKECTNQQVS